MRFGISQAVYNLLSISNVVEGFSNERVFSVTVSWIVTIRDSIILSLYIISFKNHLLMGVKKY